MPKGTLSDYGEYIRLMCDMMVLAFQMDRTRIAAAGAKDVEVIEATGILMYPMATMIYLIIADAAAYQKIEKLTGFTSCSLHIYWNV